MKKIILLLLISFGVNAQTRIKYSQMENPATSSISLISTAINGTLSVGSASAIGTSSLVRVYITKGTSTVAIGERSAGLGGIWLSQATPTTSNYAIIGNTADTYVNAPSSTLYLTTNNTARATITSNGVDVTGRLTASGDATITGNTTQTGSLTVGSAVVQSSLANFYVNKGTSTVAIGERSSGLAGLWLNKAVPTTTNYSLIGDASDTYINASGTLFLASGGSAVASVVPGIFKTAAAFSCATTSTLTGQVKMTNTLNLEGNTTWNTNQTNTLTTGNTGTVAVLSDAVFPVTFNFTSSSPADATTYYFGAVNSQLNTTSTISKNTLPYNCTLVAWDFTQFYTAGSAETATLSIAGTTNYTLSTALASNVGGAATLNGSGLSQNFNASDAINAKMVCPTWVTNPTGLYGTLTLWFVRRQ